MANVGGEEYGPFTWDQMLQMAAEGRVTPELPIRKVSDSQWSTAAAIPGLLGGAKPAAQKAAAPSAAAPAAKSAIKKAKPLARPPVSRPAPPVVNAPQNIPVGVPAGIPVGAPVGVAVGSPASSSSGAFNFDLNAAPSGKQRTVKKSVLDDEDSPAIKKKGNTPLLIGALGGGAALVAIIVGITVYITMFRGGKEEKVVATNTSTETEGTDEEGAESNPGETNPEGEADSGSKKAAAAKTKAAKGTKATTPDAKSPPKSDQKAIVEGIREWKNIVTLKSVGIGICVPDDEVGVCLEGSFNIVEAKLKPSVAYIHYDLTTATGLKGAQSKIELSLDYELHLLSGAIDARLVLGPWFSFTYNIFTFNGLKLPLGGNITKREFPQREDFK